MSNKINPYNGEILYNYSSHSMMDIIKMIQVSNSAFTEWRKSTVEERLKYLEVIIQNYISKKSEIITAESWDQGLPFSFTEKANYAVGLKTLENFRTQLLQPTEKSVSPNGVVAVILSWNLSNRLFIEKAIAAMLAGNTVIVKVSSQAVSTVKLWSEILSALPELVVQFVVTSDNECKRILATHPGIKAVVVTGTLETCAQILKNQSVLAEKQFKKVQLNSGSKNSCIVLDEPNAQLVPQVMETFLTGQGQLVWNSARLFILEKHQSQWVEAIQSFFKHLQPAQSPEDASMWGPLIKPALNYAQLKVTAEQAHAKFITVGKDGPLFTYDMSNCSELQQDELHLPLFLISAVKYGFDIPKHSNVSYYGHSASIFSQSAVSEKITQHLDVGHISLNQWSIFGDLFIQAVKQSAYGIQDHQIFGDFYSNVKILS